MLKITILPQSHCQANGQRVYVNEQEVEICKKEGSTYERVNGVSNTAAGQMGFMLQINPLDQPDCLGLFLYRHFKGPALLFQYFF